MQTPIEWDGVQGVLHEPEPASGDGLVLTHGAGSNANAPLLVRLGEAFSSSGLTVLRYDLPFRRQRPKGPPHPSASARDREGILQAAEAMRKRIRGRLFAGGHSYGGRQTAMAAAANPDMAEALLLLSYPLYPPGKPDQKRTAYFPDLRTPALFVHGTADPFGTPEELREAMSLIPARVDLLVVEGAAHDLKRGADLATEILERLQAL